MSKIEAGYKIETLEKGIEACKKNIKVFEEAIAKERTMIDEYYVMIEVLKQKSRIPKNITVEVERE